MKKLFPFLFLSLFLIVGCTSDDDESEKTPYFNVVIDDRLYSATDEDLLKIEVAKNLEVKSLGIITNVEHSGGKSGRIAFVIKNYEGAGSYYTADIEGNENVIYYTDLESSETWSSGANELGIVDIGEITVEKDDDEIISGKFSCQVRNYIFESTKIIKEGAFQIIY